MPTYKQDKINTKSKRIKAEQRQNARQSKRLKASNDSGDDLVGDSQQCDQSKELGFTCLTCSDALDDDIDEAVVCNACSGRFHSQCVAAKTSTNGSKTRGSAKNSSMAYDAFICHFCNPTTRKRGNIMDYKDKVNSFPERNTRSRRSRQVTIDLDLDEDICPVCDGDCDCKTGNMPQADPKPLNDVGNDRQAIGAPSTVRDLLESEEDCIGHPQDYSDGSLGEGEMSDDALVDNDEFGSDSFSDLEVYEEPDDSEDDEHDDENIEQEIMYELVQERLMGGWSSSEEEDYVGFHSFFKSPLFQGIDPAVEKKTANSHSAKHNQPLFPPAHSQMYLLNSQSSYLSDIEHHHFIDTIDDDLVTLPTFETPAEPSLINSCQQSIANDLLRPHELPVASVDVHNNALVAPLTNDIAPAMGEQPEGGDESKPLEFDIKETQIGPNGEITTTTKSIQLNMNKKQAATLKKSRPVYKRQLPNASDASSSSHQSLLPLVTLQTNVISAVSTIGKADESHPSGLLSTMLKRGDLSSVAAVAALASNPTAMRAAISEIKKNGEPVKLGTNKPVKGQSQPLKALRPSAIHDSASSTARKPSATSSSGKPLSKGFEELVEFIQNQSVIAERQQRQMANEQRSGGSSSVTERRQDVVVGESNRSSVAPSVVVDKQSDSMKPGVNVGLKGVPSSRNIKKKKSKSRRGVIRFDDIVDSDHFTDVNWTNGDAASSNTVVKEEDVENADGDEQSDANVEMGASDGVTPKRPLKTHLTRFNKVPMGVFWHSQRSRSRKDGSKQRHKQPMIKETTATLSPGIQFPHTKQMNESYDLTRMMMKAGGQDETVNSAMVHGVFSGSPMATRSSSVVPTGVMNASPLMTRVSSEGGRRMQSNQHHASAKYLAACLEKLTNEL